jgi:hypothetical protein
VENNSLLKILSKEFNKNMCPELQFQKQGQDSVMTLNSIENQDISSPMIKESGVGHAYKYSGTVLGSPIL